jgi:lipopolysaccharide biosynthesis glycosyltransferase
MINIASIVTQNYVEQALTMFNSMLKYRKDCHIDILVVTGTKQDTQINLKNVTLHHISDFYDHPKFGTLYRLTIARPGTTPETRPTIIALNDYLRWSLKPIFSRILLEQYDRVFFCDHDLYFYKDFTFLDKEAEGKTICLSPHWRTINYTVENEMEFNFRHGLFNGGFFIVNKSGAHILDWWAEMTANKCTALENDPTYVDQKYLDIVPIYFNDVHVIKHKGCNVAAWNRSYNKRTIVNNEVRAGNDEIIFIHYSPVTIKQIENGMDHLLQEHYDQYKSAIIETKIQLTKNNLNHLTTRPITGTNLV